MPKLMLLTAAEKVLIEDSGNASLLNVLSTIEIKHTGGGQIPENALSPKEWAVFAVWKAEKGDKGKTFKQHTKVIAPNGVEFGASTSEWVMEKPSQNIRLNVPGMPVGKAGDLTITISLEANGKKIGSDYSYAISLIHAKA